ncbi:MAG: S41 family peptidase [Alphaproteobacteria bacterium]|nr:S41 family peptidase [Alphaproteobacteria bacterium]
MKKILTALLLITNYCLLITFANATELFDKDMPVVDGISVFEMSDVFADIYEKLESIKWGGKDINIAIESLEKLDKDAHIAATDERVVLVWKDTIVGNWPRPRAGDWRAFGQITTALVLKLREEIAPMRSLTDSGIYEVVVGALMRGVDESGRYIYSARAESLEDGRLLTSAGLEGAQDERGNFRVSGVYRGGLADTGDIREGDLITEINGRAMSTMTPSDIGAAFSGFNSGTLKLTVLAPGGARPVTLRRATVVIADADIIWKDKVDAEQIDAKTGILEIVLTKVSDNSAAIINEALAKYGARTTGIVLDMRVAGGNEERAAAKIAGLFMGRIPALRSVETAKEETEISPGGNAVIPFNIPVVVLVSGGTTGTAEALAASFYEQGRGLLIGTPTAGRARLASRLNLKNGGQLEVLNRTVKTGVGRIIDGRGIFPIVCLSNIRNAEQQNAFFVNVINGDFGGRDFNKEPNIDPEAVRKGCPQIISGADEDAVSTAVSMKVLTDAIAYDALMKK